MKKITIDCIGISDRDELHKTLADKLSFPEWYGENLDALYDCLTGICDETMIIIENFDVLERLLDKYAISFKKVILKADEDNEKITVKIRKKKFYCAFFCVILSLTAFLTIFIIFSANAIFNVKIFYLSPVFWVYAAIIGFAALTAFLLITKKLLPAVLTGICLLFSFSMSYVIYESEHADYKITLSDGEKNITALTKSSPLSTEADTIILYEQLIPNFIGKTIYNTSVRRTAEPLSEILEIVTDDNKLILIYCGTKMEDGVMYSPETKEWKKYYIQDQEKNQ